MHQLTQPFESYRHFSVLICDFLELLEKLINSHSSKRLPSPLIIMHQVIPPPLDQYYSSYLRLKLLLYQQFETTTLHFSYFLIKVRHGDINKLLLLS